MKISVIVPLYNAEKYVEPMVRCLSDSTSNNTEFIFINDGSTDQTKELCEAAKESLPNLTVIHKENGGVSSARNAGLDVAKGEYICFADCDDAPKPNMYSVLASEADRCESDMILGGYEKVDANGNITVVNIPYQVNVSAKIVAYSMAFWSGFVDGESIHMLYGSVWPNLYKKSIIDKHNICFPQGIVLGEDLLFNIEYLSYCETVRVLNQPLYRYSVGNESATRKQIPNLWERYKRLVKRSNELLTKAYGESEELSTNVARQYINNAISVVEEQIIPFENELARDKIKAICQDLNEMDVLKKMLTNGTMKERLEAGVFQNKMTRLIYQWLK